MESTDVPRPKQGEIWLTVFGAARIGEPGKTRPAIVLSSSDQMTGSVYDLVVVVPISSTIVPSAVRPQVVATPGTGLMTDSVAVVRAIRGMSPARLITRLGEVTPATLHEVQEVLKAVVDLP